MSNYERGDIYYISNYNRQTRTVERTPGGNRPVIIISSDEINRYETRFVVVNITSNLTTSLGDPIPVECGDVDGYAIPSSISTIRAEQCANYVGHLSGPTMLQLEQRMIRDLGLEGFLATSAPAAPTKEDDEPTMAINAEQVANVVRLEAERDLYKKMYDELLGRLVAR